MNAKHPLGALIEQAKRTNGWSDIDVANRAKARGHILSKSNVARIRNDEVTTLVGKQLHALAAGLGVPVQQLAAAGLESMGIPGYIASATDAEQAVRMDPSLPEHVRRTLITIIRNERDRELGDGNGERTEEVAKQGTQAGSPVDSSEARGNRLRPGAPMNGDNVAPLTRKKQGSALDDRPSTIPHQPRELAAMKGETDELRRRRLEGEPGEHPDPEGPEDGA